MVFRYPGFDASIDQVFAADPAMRGCFPILASPALISPLTPAALVTGRDM